MRVYLDACAIIYAIEGLPKFRNVVLAQIAAVRTDPNGIILTSRLSRLECRVKPVKDQNLGLLGAYDGFFTRTSINLVEITGSVIERATELRASHGFKTPDAIHLASALENGADLFLTGDAGLSRCPGMRIEILS
jgi:predicted nucleic acid-binding protein